MTVTQVRLTDEEASRLVALAARNGEAPEEVARRAVTDYLASHAPGDWQAARKAACGIWAGRDDLPDLRELRDECDRRLVDRDED